MHKKNSCYCSPEELYGFADEKFVHNLQKKYVKYFKKGPVIDLGCGRGIFLQILKEHKLDGIGVDNSNLAFEYLRNRGFKIYQDDALKFLKNFVKERKTSSGIFCSHFIEHLPPEDAKELLQLCFDALEPGGILIVITPNPKDLRVMTDIFWLDQTHVRPYPLDLLKVMFTRTGFKIKDFGIDQDTKLKHFKNNLFDRISKFFFSKTPVGIYLNTGHDIFVVGEKPL